MKSLMDERQFDEFDKISSKVYSMLFFVTSSNHFFSGTLLKKEKRYLKC